MAAPLPIGYRTSTLEMEFLRGQFRKFAFLRWSLEDLSDLARTGEELLKRRQNEARDTNRVALSACIVRGSVIVMACGALESFLTSFCDLLHKSQKLDRAPNQLRGSTLERARKYIKDDAGLPFPDLFWPNLVALFNVRHAIIHADGKMTNAGKMKDVRKYLPSITVDSTGEVWPEIGATESTLKLISDFVDQVEQEIVGPSRKQAFAD